MAGPFFRKHSFLTECLQNCIRLQNLLLHPRRDVGRDGAEILQDELCRLRLAGAALARDDEGLVDALGGEVAVRGLGQGKDVGWEGAGFLAVVLEDGFLEREKEKNE